MATDTYSVQANQTTATQVVFAGDGPTLVINTSLTDNIFLSEDNSARVSDGNGLIPINPNGSLVVDGTRDFYAVTASITPVTIATVAGGLANFRALTSGLGKLAVPSIQSPNFEASPLTGWSIDQNGNAFFESVVIGGGVVRVTFAATPPPSPNEGDVWFDLSSGAQPNVFQGGVFVPHQWGQQSIANAAIGTPQIANNAVTPAQIASLTASLIGQTGGILNANPYFTGGDGSGWAAGGTAAFSVTNTPPAGIPFPNVAKLVGGGGPPNKLFDFNEVFPVQPNTQYLVSGFVYSPVSTINFGMDWRDANKTLLGETGPIITVPVNTWTPISAVVTSPSTAGLALGNIFLYPAAPGGTMYAAGLIALPQIPGALIQTNSITAAQLIAGLVIAGIIDGTTVNAATFNGSTFNGSDFEINSNGAFFYSGTPAAGNLLISITNNAGKDQFNNSYLAGTTAYNHSIVLNTWTATVLNGQASDGNSVEFYTSATQAGPWINQAVIAVDTSGTLKFGAGSDIQLIVNGINILELKSSMVLAYQSVTAIQPGTTNTPETWHNITLDAGWTAGGQAPQYRLLPDGNVQVRGNATHAGVTVGTSINGSNPIPVGYQPNSTRFYRSDQSADAAGAVQIGTTGIFTMRASGFTATQAIMDGIYSI